MVENQTIEDEWVKRLLEIIDDCIDSQLLSVDFEYFLIFLKYIFDSDIVDINWAVKLLENLRIDISIANKNLQ